MNVNNILSVKYPKLILVSVIFLVVLNLVSVVISKSLGKDLDNIFDLYITNTLGGIMTLGLVWQFMTGSQIIYSVSGLKRALIFKISVIFNIFVYIYIVCYANYLVFSDLDITYLSVNYIIEDISFIFYVYSSMWIAKSIVRFEWGGNVNILDYLGTGIQIMFVWLMIWSIQPRVNRIQKESRGHPEPPPV